MKLVTFQVTTPTGVQRRLGALQDERIVDLTTAGGRAAKMAKYHDGVLVLEYVIPAF